MDFWLLGECLLAGGATGLGAVWLQAAGERLRDYLKPPPKAKWQVTIVDPDGIPTRQDSLSVEGVARLIRDINTGYYK